MQVGTLLFWMGLIKKLFHLESVLAELGDRILCAPSKYPSTGREGLRMLPSQSKLLCYSSPLPLLVYEDWDQFIVDGTFFHGSAFCSL